MTLKMKERYYKGVTKAEKYEPREPILPGCALEHQRKALNALYGKVSDDEFDARLKQMYKDGAKEVGAPPIILKMPLAHGDIIIMHGAEMQKYFVVWNSSPSLLLHVKRHR